MINFDDVTKENIKEHNPNWPQIHDHPHNINTWRLWIRENKFIIQHNKSVARY